MQRRTPHVAALARPGRATVTWRAGVPGYTGLPAAAFADAAPHAAIGGEAVNPTLQGTNIVKPCSGLAAVPGRVKKGAQA